MSGDLAKKDRLALFVGCFVMVMAWLVILLVLAAVVGAWRWAVAPCP